jgi:hypothetical protein
MPHTQKDVDGSVCDSSSEIKPDVLQQWAPELARRTGVPILRRANKRVETCFISSATKSNREDRGNSALNPEHRPVPRGSAACGHKYFYSSVWRGGGTPRKSLAKRSVSVCALPCGPCSLQHTDVRNVGLICLGTLVYTRTVTIYE